MKRKLSKVGWLIVICCIVLVGSSAYADTKTETSSEDELRAAILNFKPGSEPDGFRGIKWGQDISTVGGLFYVATNPSYGGIDYYIREEDELRMGGAELAAILYYFWQDKFCDVRIYTKGSPNWSIFKAIVFEKFGEGHQDNEYIEEYVWWGEKTLMLLTYDEVSKRGVLYMFSTDITKQQEEWKKEQVKKGVEEGW